MTKTINISDKTWNWIRNKAREWGCSYDQVIQRLIQFYENPSSLPNNNAIVVKLNELLSNLVNKIVSTRVNDVNELAKLVSTLNQFITQLQTLIGLLRQLQSIPITNTTPQTPTPNTTQTPVQNTQLEEQVEVPDFIANNPWVQILRKRHS